MGISAMGTLSLPRGPGLTPRTVHSRSSRPSSPAPRRHPHPSLLLLRVSAPTIVSMGYGELGDKRDCVRALEL